MYIYVIQESIILAQRLGKTSREEEPWREKQVKHLFLTSPLSFCDVHCLLLYLQGKQKGNR